MRQKSFQWLFGIALNRFFQTPSDVPYDTETNNKEADIRGVV